MTTPGGIWLPNWVALNEGVDKSGYARIDKSTELYGEILIFEKKNPDKSWSVRWMTRNLTCELECSRTSSQPGRIKAANKHALLNLKKRETVYKEFH